MIDLFESHWSELWGDSGGPEAVGAVYTRPEVVDIILDLAGYTPGKRRLATMRVLEPSCGDGAFLLAVVRRMIESEQRHGSSGGWSDAALDGALRAVDINASAIARARTAIEGVLVEAGCPRPRATSLAATWTVHADFLLTRWPERFDLVVGNPPYVRIEDIPKRVLTRYRELFETTRERADLYVAFIEKGLELLSPDGCLAFICANRFTKNRYGAALRRLIGSRFRVRYYINLEHTQPFESDVSAYPAIFIIDRKQGASTLAVTLDDVAASTLARLVDGHGTPYSSFRVWYPNGEPWTTTNARERDILESLSRHPLLEDSGPGTTVGIGVATGADRVFVLDRKREDIEDSRQLPLLMASDIRNSSIDWSGHHLLNPFMDDGALAKLELFPKMAEYLGEHAVVLRRRHVARARPAGWYRTIDRIWPELRHVPKLVIPDIQANGTVIGYDPGEYYPHHNLYWVTSRAWDLRALKTLLRSEIVRQQVRAFSVQMRGGSLRFQAQTLRRIRVPSAGSLGPALAARLAELAESNEQELIDAAAAEAFGR